MTLSRRHLLKGIGAGALSAATLTTLGNAMYGFQAANAAGAPIAGRPFVQKKCPASFHRHVFWTSLRKHGTCVYLS